MPGWIQAIVGAAAFFVALGTLWAKALRPGARLITMMETTVPLLADLPILQQIIKEFRTNAGSSLKDAIDRIEARQSELHATVLSNALATDTKMAVLTTQQAVTTALLERLDAKVSIGVVGGQRLEAQAAGVADDLLRSHRRADATSGEPGAQADAASRSDPEEGT